MATETSPDVPVGVPVPAPTATSLGALVAKLRRRGSRVGLAAVGIAPATPMERSRIILEERKAAGLSAGMQFTYRNPSRSTDPGRALPGAAALVVGAWSYDHGGHQAAPTGDQGRGAAPTGDQGRGAVPTGDRGAGPCPPAARPGPKELSPATASRDHYGDLRAALASLAQLLEEAGWAARVVVDDNALVDRAAAERAGLGWFGKNTNVLLPGRGSWFLLGSVVTDAPLPPDAPVGDGCGTCRRCLGSCPTGALVEPGVLDARRCLAWLLQAAGAFPFEYREALGARIYGCDDCQESCPANRVAAGFTAAGSPPAARPYAARPAAGSGGADERTVDLLEMLCAPDAALLARHGRWYIAQREPRYLRRNALLVLANTGDGHAPAVEEALGRYLAGPDDMLRAHAIWAAVRIGRRDLLGHAPGLSDDPSSMVQDEMRRLDEITPRRHC